jgi:hypothetical protein
MLEARVASLIMRVVAFNTQSAPGLQLMLGRADYSIDD